MVFTSKKPQSFLWPGWASRECQHRSSSLGLADLWAAPSQCPSSFRAMSAHCDAEVVEQCLAVLLHPVLSWLSSTQKHLLLKKCEEREADVCYLETILLLNTQEIPVTLFSLAST